MGKDAEDSTYSDTVPSDAGDYTVKASIAAKDNYKAATATANFTIAAAAITPTVSLEGWTYGATANEPSVSGNTGSSTVTNSYKEKDAEDSTYSDTVPTNAGDYTVRASIAAAGNYNAAAATANFTITAADINPTVSITGWTYGATANEPSVSGNAGNGTVTYAYKVKDAEDSTYSTTVPTNAGDYTVRASIAAAGNYNAASAAADFTIAAADITPTVSITGWTYGATANEPSVSGNIGNGAVTYTYATKGSTEFSATVPTDAGEYTVKATVKETENYNSGTATADFTITKASAGVTAPTALNLAYTGSAQALAEAGAASGGTLQYALGQDGETAPADELYSTRIPEATNVGTYYIWFRVAGDKNHNDVEASHIVSAISHADTGNKGPEADTLTYSGEPQALVTAGTVTGGTMYYALGENAQTAPTDEAWSEKVPSGTDAGEYYVWFKIKGDANHKDVAPAYVPVSIAKAGIDPAVSLTGWTYGDEKNNPSVTGNEGNGEITYTYSAKEDGDYSEDVPTNAGTYYVKAAVAETDNYNGAVSLPLSFAILKRPVTITADGKTSAYGEKTAELTCQVEGGIVAGDDLGITAVTEATETSDAGTYPIVVSWNKNANYSAVLADGTYTITKAPITITAENKTGTRGNKLEKLTYKISGSYTGGG